MSRILTVLLWSCSIFLGGCGTFTGIPSHGGGKRFSEEQRLVTASIRASLMQLDVRQLRGKRVFIMWNLIADQGGGNLSGGRASLSGVLQAASMISPTSMAANQFGVFDLVGSGTNASNSTGSGNQVAVGQTVSTDSSTEASTSSGTTTPGSTTTVNNSATQTGTVITNQNGTTTTTQTPTISTGAGTSAGSSTGTNNSTGTTNNTSVGNQTGNFNNSQQTLTSQPTSSQQRNKGNEGRAGAELQFKGFGDYASFAVPISDSATVMNLTTAYLKLSGSEWTTDINRADVLLYFNMDIFGINRSRFDSYIYNSEQLLAETAIEIFAFDREGRLIMKPQNSSYEATYGERYILWAGPFKTQKKVKKGQGMLVNFSGVDGTKPSYPASITKETPFQIPQ
jgi:hypothetical protein